ncbi:MAG: hypothetical protein ACM3YM_04660 [Sphingomonadales bacterium]
MRKILISMAALSALAAATPAAAQYSSTYDYRYGPDEQVQRLQSRLDEDLRRGLVSRYDAERLRNQLWQLQRVSNRYRYNGMSRWERDDLTRRIATVRDQLFAAENARGYNRGYGNDGQPYDRGYGYDQGDAYGNDVGTSDEPAFGGESYDQGDAYDQGDVDDQGVGDSGGPDDQAVPEQDETYIGPVGEAGPGGALSVGDRAPDNLAAVPPQYRSLYPDGDLVYYRYGEGRIYQIDRTTNTIRWVGDLPY